MSDRVDLTCPCCGTHLVADVATGEILSEDRPKSSKTFDDAVGEVRSGSKRREDAFSKAFDRTRNLDDLLEKVWQYLDMLRIYTKPRGQIPVDAAVR